VSEARALGYEQALAAHGITDRFVEITAGPNADVAARCGQEAAQRLLRRYPEVTALFCYSDLTALGAMKGVERMGLRVPDDVAVVGFDDEPWAEHLTVPLTTVRQPVEEFAQVTANLLHARLAGDDGPWQRVEVTPTLVVRESSGGPEVRRNLLQKKAQSRALHEGGCDDATRFYAY
jgi:DNA-binding LacI/PurR family transcriptional regulator